MLTIEDINPKLLQAQYAVRGKIAIRALELERQGRFITYCNIGNPHLFRQKPLTYVREVLSLLEFKDLLDYDISHLFHSDSISRAKYILQQIPEGLGAYSESGGIRFVREAVARFIGARDNISTNPERILLTDGASKAAQAVLTAIINNANDGVLLPIPQYPMYSATMSLLGGKIVGYYLDEENHWQLNEKALTDSYNNAVLNGINPLAIVVINPGNPTGAVLSYANIQMVINFAKKYNLAILADEVYQENIYSTTAAFHSFAKVLSIMQVTDVSLFSIHSMSKGFYGECGHRAGYLEVRNVPDAVFAQIVKLQSINLCANLVGQIATYLMVAPPQVGEPSYALYLDERTSILNDLKEKSAILGHELNKIDGIEVNIVEGAMYAFVKITLPKHKLTASSTLSPDEEYCLHLLEETGICVVPGSGFGQQHGTFHFRTTFLPQKEAILDLVNKLAIFHKNYTAPKHT